MPHMTASPFAVNGLVDGEADGARDAERISQCPALDPVGMDPQKAWSWRYQRGYNGAFASATPHKCTPTCAKNG